MNLGNLSGGIVTGNFEVRARDRRFRVLLQIALSRPPSHVKKITSARAIVLSKRRTKSTVGLTRYSDGIPSRVLSRPTQTITFYSDLFGALSDKAAAAVIAHELAHAWLNEHVRPEESSEREAQADNLAREWGFGPELDALDREADTVPPTG